MKHVLNRNVIFFGYSGECRKLNEQLGTLRKELNETKSQVVLAEYKRETELQDQGRRAQEEIASLQHLVHGKYPFCLMYQAFSTIPVFSKLFFYLFSMVLLQKL